MGHRPAVFWAVVVRVGQPVEREGGRVDGGEEGGGEVVAFVVGGRVVRVERVLVVVGRERWCIIARVVGGRRRRALGEKEKVSLEMRMRGVG